MITERFDKKRNNGRNVKQYLACRYCFPVLLCFFLTAGCKNKEEALPIVHLKEEAEPVVVNTVEEKVEKPEEVTDVPVQSFSEDTSSGTRYGEVDKIINAYLSGDPDISDYLESLKEKNPESALQWEEIIGIWKKIDSSEANEYNTINADILPDGLSETDTLCLVVLGFQLNSDGSMKDELKERLQVAKRSAEKYPNAIILCTGGGTAMRNMSATEAGEMKKWLVAQGIDESRIVAEQASLTTGENAIYSLEILNRDFPQVCDLAIITSDYHVETGELLFESESILRYQVDGISKYKVVSNAAYMASSDTISKKFQATSLKELYADSLK